MALFRNSSWVVRRRRDGDFELLLSAELLQVVRDLFGQLDVITRPEVILSSNTSSISITNVIIFDGLAARQLSLLPVARFRGEPRQVGTRPASRWRRRTVGACALAQMM